MSVLPSPTRPRLERRAIPRIEIRCANCGYGGVVTHIPDQCPMCGEAAWRELGRRSRRSGSARRLV
jgi:hypothetical protein